jgi:glycosyltransferase involved in cell wall biosynthesis
MPTPQITVLIPTYNRSQSLRMVLPSYAADPAVARIVVVSDGSTDDTAQMVEAYAATSDIPVTLIRHETQRGQQISRMAAVATATTEFVLFGEDDVWLADGYCSTLLEELLAHNADIAGGRAINFKYGDRFSPTLLPRVKPRKGDAGFDVPNFIANLEPESARTMDAPFLHSWTLIRRSVFESVQFDPGYRGNAFREETDFYLSARTQGFRLIFTPRTVCYHLRGSLNATGGQRGRRFRKLWVEYWCAVNTYRMTRKHWAFLTARDGFRGTPLQYLIQQYLPYRAGLLLHSMTRKARPAGLRTASKPA